MGKHQLKMKSRMRTGTKNVGTLSDRKLAQPTRRCNSRTLVFLGNENADGTTVQEVAATTGETFLHSDHPKQNPPTHREAETFPTETNPKTYVDSQTTDLVTSQETGTGGEFS